MEGMTILRVLLAVVAVIVIGAIIYWIGNSTSNAKSNQESKSQQPTFPAANIATEDAPSPVEEKKPDTIQYVSSVKLRHKSGGGVCGAIGCAMTVFLCFLYITTSEITVLQAQMLNFYTLTVIAAVLSFFGSCNHDASCVLLASVALVSAFFLNTDAVFGLIPALVLEISYKQMKYSIDIEVKKKKLEQ